MTEDGCSGFEETWPYGEETYPDGTTIETIPTWEQPESLDPNAWTGIAEPTKVESDYKLAGVPVFAWIMLITAIVAVFCVGFYYFALVFMLFILRNEPMLNASCSSFESLVATSGNKIKPSRLLKLQLMQRLQQQLNLNPSPKPSPNRLG